MDSLKERLRASQVLSRGSEIVGEVLPCNTADEAAERIERLEKENASLRHWSVAHIDALLLYAAGSYPNDSHVKDAVAFCRIVAPKWDLRMDFPKRLEASECHPLRACLVDKELPNG